MAGMHVLLFVDCTKDFKRSSMIVKKISKELFDHGHEVTILGNHHNIFLFFFFFISSDLGSIIEEHTNFELKH